MAGHAGPLRPSGRKPRPPGPGRSRQCPRAAAGGWGSGDIWAARRAGLGLPAGWAPLTRRRGCVGRRARAGRPAWGREAQLDSPLITDGNHVAAGPAEALRPSAAFRAASGRRGGLGWRELRQGNVRRPDSRPGDKCSESPLAVPSSPLASPFLLARQHGGAIKAGRPLAAAVPHAVWARAQHGGAL